MVDATQILEMSDDDILNMSGPPSAEGTGTDTPSGSNADDTLASSQADDTVVANAGEDTVEGGQADDTLSGGNGDDTVAAADGGDTVAAADGEDTLKGASGAAADDKKPAEGAAAAANRNKEGAAPSGSEAATVDYKAAYDQIMAPFKANGKTIQLKSPEEAIQLMQMGANYTRKMQDIQPHRKMLLMLQNNGLLDEGKLSYLIDLDKKDPNAIKKLIKDSGIDPLEIDTSVEPAYTAGNHRVTDQEANFRNVLDEVNSTPAGQETVKLINDRWDQTSKEALWASPEIVSVIHEQRETGIYATIVEEMDRQITLGKIPPNTPFLQAYKAIGDQLAEAKVFEKLSGAGTGPNGKETPANVPPTPAIVATRVAAPKSQVSNGDQASAAAPTRTGTRKAEKFVNPLAMSDDEFMKLEPFKSRV